MICDAKLHFERIPSSRLAIKLMRIERPCGCESRTVALCAYCYEIDLAKLERNMMVRCDKCGFKYRLAQSWSMIGDA